MLLEHALRPELGGAFADIEKPLVNVLAGMNNRHMMRKSHAHKCIRIVIPQFASQWLTNCQDIFIWQNKWFTGSLQFHFASHWLAN